MTPSLIIELTAAAFGVLGTVLLALNGPRAGWIAFAWIHAHWGLLAQQLAFVASSLLGVWIWLIKPQHSHDPEQVVTDASQEKKDSQSLPDSAKDGDGGVFHPSNIRKAPSAR
jgi:nicotinamide riboside transporter PnuC